MKPSDFLEKNLPSRDDPKWNWMRVLGTEGVRDESVFGKLNQYVELPDLGHTFYPAGIGPANKLKQIFITPQYAKVLESMWKTINIGHTDVENEDKEAGCILIGPEGIGKSVLCYLVVCTAYMNKAIVIYFVWTKTHIISILFNLNFSCVQMRTMFDFNISL